MVTLLFFWYDNWLQMGRLLDITGDVGTYYLGVARTTRVSEAVLHQIWNITGHRSRHFHALRDRIQAERGPLTSMEVMWCSGSMRMILINHTSHRAKHGIKFE